MKPGRRRQDDARSRATARGGFTAETACACGNTGPFEYDTDSMTGSSYARCRRCHSVLPFAGAWRDNALGMNFGSWWSQQLGKGFVVE